MTMSSNEPAVSVVMPAFNAALWIADAIRSVLGQTMSDWELIVVNDGSTDDTDDVVRGFRDPRIRVVSQANGGAANSRNVGIRMASGRYIALLDADDWYQPRHLERTVSFLDSHVGCSLVGTNYYFIDHTGKTTLGCKAGEILGAPGDGIIPDFFRATMRNRCFPITCCAVFRRGLVAELGEFDPSLRTDEDHDFWTRWALRSRFGYIDEPLSFYREDTPGSNRKDLRLSIRSRLRSWQKLAGLQVEYLPCNESFGRCRSFYLFRLVALAAATGHIDEVRQISALWPPSPGHLHWWMGKTLASLPTICLQAIAGILSHTDMVRYRQGRPAPLDAYGTETSYGGSPTDPVS